MKPLLLLPAVALAAFAAFAPHADAGGRRLTKFEAGTLRPVVAGVGAVKATNYVLDYAVTNEAAAARKPGLRLEVRTKDTKKTHGDAFDAAVFARVAKDTNAAEPQSTAKLRSVEMAGGAKASALANFGTIDPQSNEFQVRVYNLYDPVFRDKWGKTWSEHRVLVLTYKRPGDEFDRHLDPITLVSTVEEVEGEAKEVHPTK